MDTQNLVVQTTAKFVHNLEHFNFKALWPPDSIVEKNVLTKNEQTAIPYIRYLLFLPMKRHKIINE